MRARIASALVIAALVPTGVARAAGQPSTDEKAVLQVVEQFLDDLGNHRADKVTAAVAPKGSISVVRQRDGQWTTTYQTFEEWLAGLKGQASGPTFREPLTNVSVSVESGRLAHVRADFTVVVDGQVRSHGVDYFTLAKDGDAWKMLHIAYTSFPGK